LEAQRGDAETVRRPQMPLTVGASPDDVERLIGMLAALSRFGRRLARICDECVDALEELTPPGAEDTAAQQRVDDDGMPPKD
jgi:hypothetical protein